MALTIEMALKAAPVVPLVQANDPTTACRITEALLAGGLKVIEVVLRSDAALDCLSQIVTEFPEAFIGAGTVLSAEQAQITVDVGAKFIVSPGLDDGVVGVANNGNIPVLPGIATATELQRAWNMGLRLVKFFPAGSAGGPKMLKDLSGPFRDMQFMPTGGINAENLPDYLAIPAVIGCGGSWLTPPKAIEKSDFATITALASTALNIAHRQK